MGHSVKPGSQRLPLASGNNTLDIDAFVKRTFLTHMERLGLKHEAVAALMGISRQQLAMQLQPGGHLSVTRLLRLAEDEDGALFMQAVWTDVADYLGLDSTDAIAQELRRFQGRLGWIADKLQVRMAKSELRAVEQARRRA